MLRYAVLITMALLCAVPAHASPEDPDGNDWVAIAVAPANGVATYGGGGTHDEAIRIAMDECHQRTSGRCEMAKVLEYGCAAYTWNIHTQSWAGGAGPTVGGD